MKKSRNIPIRFGEDLISEMEIAADTIGMENRSDLIKVCVKTFLRDFKRYGTAVLPPDWREIARGDDGRRNPSPQREDHFLKVAETKTTWDAKKKGAKP